ncbi:MAG: TFIIB-type zinc ribbon-containing protein [Candidatus Bathyarchaeia archaeon]
MMLVVLGPFRWFRASSERIVFGTDKDALVPKKEISLKNERIYSIYKHKTPIYKNYKTLIYNYYVVYETNELNFYEPYLGKVPDGARGVSELSGFVCPECGSLNVGRDTDELFCEDCGASDFWSTETVVWRERIPQGEVIEGEGIMTIPEDAYKEAVVAVKVLGVKEVKLGNLKGKEKEVIGYLASRPYNPAVYKVYETDFGSYALKARDLTKEELAEVEMARGLAKKDRLEEIEESFSDLMDVIALERGERVIRVKLKRRVDDETFRKYLGLCRSLGMKYNGERRAWELTA